MLLKLIGCEVFTREICAAISTSPHTIDPEFTDLGAHLISKHLNALLQAKIDSTSESTKKYDAILLCFGLCGNSTVGLISRTVPLIIPRAHDCCTIFLGSKGRFKEHFSDNPSRPFSSTGYFERGQDYLHEAVDFSSISGMTKTYEDYVKQYGEEDAKYIWETMRGETIKKVKEIVFIDMPESKHLGIAKRCMEKAEQNGEKFIQLEGNDRLIRKMINGEWDQADFVIIQPGERIAGVYDWDQVIKAEKG